MMPPVAGPVLERTAPTDPGRSPPSDAFPLSPMQEGMLFHHLSDRRRGVDVEQIVLTLREPLDLDRFRMAWEQVARRHGTLRLSIQWWDTPRPVQWIRPETRVDMVVEDWRHRSPEGREADLAAFLAADRTRGVDLATPPLWRVRLFRFGSRDHRCVWTFHHVLMDGRSFPLVLSDLFHVYEAHLEGAPQELPPAPSYRAHLDWLEGRCREGERAFWSRYLAGAQPTPPITVPVGSEPPADPLGRGEREVTLDREGAALRRAAERHGVTLNTLVQGAWAILLGRYTGATEVVFGSVRAGRHGTTAGAEATAGVFMNTVPVRVRVEGTRRVDELLRQLRADHLGIRPWEHTPLADIQRWVGATGDTPLLGSAVVFDHARLGTTLREFGGGWRNRDAILLERTSLPLTLYGYGEEIPILKLAYDRSHLPDREAGEMVEHLREILAGMARGDVSSVAELPRLSPRARRGLQAEREGARRDWPLDRTVHGSLAEQVRRTPEGVALRCGETTLTWGELQERATLIARRLRAVGTGPEVRVGIGLGLGPELLPAILGVLEAGGAWVPLDPAYPDERLEYMLADSGAAALVAPDGFARRIPGFRGAILSPEERTDRRQGGDPTPGVLVEGASPPGGVAGAGSAAYVMYTSGSTGRPKGVVIEHRSVANLFASMDELLLPAGRRTWLALTTPSFDISVLELLWTLTRGFQVVMPSSATPGSEDVGRLLVEHDVSHLQCTPSRARLLLADPGVRAALGGLECMLVGGEALPGPVADALSQAVGGRVLNMYGPTETTIWSTAHPVRPGEADGITPIGRPLGNTTLHVVDADLGAVPPGTPGELCIGGAGLARGYLDRPELTAARFLPLPFPPFERVYRTGDRVRRREDGVLEFLGRLDGQVKIRGHRIEPGEIEAVLRECPGVGEVVVAPRAGGPDDMRIVAWVVPSGAPWDSLEEALRDHAVRRLPPVMVPSAYVQLDSMPLSPNGKIDRSRLPAPGAARRPSPARPATAEEAELARIFAGVLGTTEVGVEENFFDAGGHSLLVLRLQARIRGELQRELSLDDLFRHPTVRSLASRLATVASLAPARDEARLRRVLREFGREGE